MEAQHVVVPDVQMNFGSMVAFMVKGTLAAIPVMLILFVVYFLAAAVVAISRETFPG